MEVALTSVLEEFNGFCANAAGRIHAAAQEELSICRVEIESRQQALDAREQLLDERERSLERREAALRQAGGAESAEQQAPRRQNNAALPGAIFFSEQPLAVKQVDVGSPLKGRLPCTPTPARAPASSSQQPAAAAPPAPGGIPGPSPLRRPGVPGIRRNALSPQQVAPGHAAGAEDGAQGMGMASLASSSAQDLAAPAPGSPMDVRRSPQGSPTPGPARAPRPSLSLTQSAGNASKLKAMFEQKSAQRNASSEGMRSARRTAPAAAQKEEGAPKVKRSLQELLKQDEDQRLF